MSTLFPVTAFCALVVMALVCLWTKQLIPSTLDHPLTLYALYKSSCYMFSLTVIVQTSHFFLWPQYVLKYMKDISPINLVIDGRIALTEETQADLVPKEE